MITFFSPYFLHNNSPVGRLWDSDWPKVTQPEKNLMSPLCVRTVLAVSFNTKIIHIGEQLSRCRDCGNNFIENSTLKKHQQVHTWEETHRCLGCGENFSLNYHLATPREVTQDSNCIDCGKGFRDTSCLTIHQQSHTGEKPYTCDMHWKGFVLSSVYLNDHQTHTVAVSVVAGLSTNGPNWSFTRDSIQGCDLANVLLWQRVLW